MKLKNLVRLCEQQEISLKFFYKLAVDNNLPMTTICKFLIRLERLRNYKGKL